MEDESRTSRGQRAMDFADLVERLGNVVIGRAPVKVDSDRVLTRVNLQDHRRLREEVAIGREVIYAQSGGHDNQLEAGDSLA